MSGMFESALLTSAAVRNSAPHLTRLEEGGVHDFVEQDLERLHGEKIYRSVRSTSHVMKLDYCQSELSNQVAGVPKSLVSLGTNVGKKRLARRWGSINHDFLVVHMTGKAKNGKEIQFCVVAEKVGEGRDKEPAGIYIGVLSEDEVRDLHLNTWISWDCYSLQVPLDVLTKALWEDQDPHYNFLKKNCWDYAQAAGKNVMLLLSKQPNLTSEKKSYFQDQAKVVKSSVLTKAAVESSTRGAVYILAGAAIFYSMSAGVTICKRLKAWMDSEDEEKTKPGKSTETIEEDKYPRIAGESDEESPGKNPARGQTLFLEGSDHAKVSEI